MNYDGRMEGNDMVCRLKYDNKQGCIHSRPVQKLIIFEIKNGVFICDEAWWDESNVTKSYSNTDLC